LPRQSQTNSIPKKSKQRELDAAKINAREEQMQKRKKEKKIQILKFFLSFTLLKFTTP
jgi:hypothetical protein